MKKQKEQHISDINCFDNESSIYQILFQDRTISMLKYIIEKISLDEYECVNFRLPSVMLIGGEGKQLIARAFSTSLCYNFEHIQGQYLGTGGYSGSLYQDVHEMTVYYISSGEKLSNYSMTLLHNSLRYDFMKFKTSASQEDVIITAYNKLFVLGVNDSKEISQDLCKATDYHCHLNNYTTENQELLIEQRLRWSHMKFEKQVPAIIVKNGEGSIGRCIRLLSASYLVMRGNNREKITIKDVEIGIALNRQEERAINTPV